MKRMHYLGAILSAGLLSGVCIAYLCALPSAQIMQVQAAEVDESVAQPAAEEPITEEQIGAAETASTQDPDLEASLTEVVLQVKKILGISDDFTDFYSNYYDWTPNPQWYLLWSSDTQEISALADIDGVVFEVYCWNSSSTTSDYFYGFDAAFPALTLDEAQQEAETWLDRLLRDNETARIDGVRVSLNANGVYRFSGTILMNGVESPVTFSMSINANGLYSFYRSDSYGAYAGELGTSEAAVSSDDAAQTLKDAIELELYYVNVDEGQAQLWYVPLNADFVVDAQTGELVDIDALYDALGISNRSSYEADTEETDGGLATEAGEGGLTEVELASIANYADAMGQNALDELLRAIDGLGLDDFSLIRCTYVLDSETGDITASLTYTLEMSEDTLFGYSALQLQASLAYGSTPTIRKYISVDAKTGKLLSVRTSYPLSEKDADADLSASELQEAAQSFLDSVAADMYAQTDLCTLNAYADDDAYTYAQVHDGYFYPSNHLYVKLNTATATVDTYSYSWDNDVVFASSEGLVDEATALDAYVDALELTLGYVAWPLSLEESGLGASELARWEELGYRYVEELILAWYFAGLDDIEGIDALSGEVVPAQSSDSGTYSYDDLEGIEQASMIEELGLAGIGFEGGAFEPTAELTQRDALTLLLQANGSTPARDDDERLQRQAVNAGFITTDEFVPDATLTRMEYLSMLLGASRYGDAAELPGIWTSAFGDVATSDEGYAAIAQALGMAQGDTFRPDDVCTRAEAAELLFLFMSR